MANIFPYEGLEYLLGILRNDNPIPTVLQVGLFDSHSPSSVPDVYAEISGLGVSEMTGAGYLRKTFQYTAWGSLTRQGNGVYMEATSPVTFGPSTGGDWLPANGFFIAIPIVNVAIFYSNFDSSVQRVVTSLNSIQVTLRIKFDN